MIHFLQCWILSPFSLSCEILSVSGKKAQRSATDLYLPSRMVRSLELCGISYVYWECRIMLCIHEQISAHTLWTSLHRSNSQLCPDPRGMSTDQYSWNTAVLLQYSSNFLLLSYWIPVLWCSQPWGQVLSTAEVSCVAAFRRYLSHHLFVSEWEENSWCQH